MNRAELRGACPSLSAPMATGDGLLARINPRHGSLSGSRLGGVARAAAAFGNGTVEITSRGSLQVRGLTPETTDRFAAMIAGLGIPASEGPEIRVGPLAGIDAAELADPRPLADAIAADIADLGLSSRLAPKLSLLVDGGGILGLEGIGGDIRLSAVGSRGDVRWQVGLDRGGGAMMSIAEGSESEARAAVVALVRDLAALGRSARGRDVRKVKGEAVAPLANPGTGKGRLLPVGRFLLAGGGLASGLAPAFGQVAAADLTRLADLAGEAREFRLAPGRGLLVIDLDEAAATRIERGAAALGFVTSRDDPRLRVVACAGAPACASGHIASRQLAAIIAADPVAMSGAATVHVSGCAKQCARPRDAKVSIIGGPDGLHIEPVDRSPGGGWIRRIADLAKGNETAGGKAA